MLAIKKMTCIKNSWRRDAMKQNNAIKKYKSKLTTILRNAEKEYYWKLLENKKHSCKETWNILNAIINKRQKDSSYPEYFEMNGSKFTTKNNIANGFNIFFANIGK